jgi:hypothetical protein
MTSTSNGLKRRRKVFLGSLAIAIALVGLLVLEYFESGKEVSKVLGDKETVVVMTDNGPVSITAKIDTGADYSAIDSTLAKSLGLHENSLNRRVTNAQGTQVRGTADILFNIGDKQISTVVSLADRSQLSTEMLLGRSDMQDFTIDPNKQFLNEPQVPMQSNMWRSFLARATNRSLNKQVILMPILAVIVIFLRLVIGVSTFGVFSPVVIALSLMLMQPNILQGVLIYIILVSIGVAMKLLLFGKMFLPNVAEMGLIMSAIVIALFGFSFLPISFQMSATAIFFPLIITTHLVERFSRTVEENKLSEAVKLLVRTMLVAILMALIGNYLVNFSQEMIWILFAVSIALVIAIGNYTGMRVMELFRFSAFRKNEK